MDLSKVPGYLFKPSGKFKYEVWLDYRGILPAESFIGPNEAALKALCQATENDTSGVILKSPGDYYLVVPDPPNGFPVMVVPEFARKMLP